MADTDNPLLSSWDRPFELPPFDSIEARHFLPAFDEAMTQDRAEIEAIASNPEPATFHNVIEALERSGEVMQRVAAIFFNLCAAETNDELQAIQREISPKLAAHFNAIYTDEALYRRVAALDPDDADLTAEARRVLERYQKSFVRAGAALDAEGRQRMGEISEKLAALGTGFGQNILADEKEYALYLEDDADLDGLPEFLIDAAAEAAKERGRADCHAITLSRSLIEPFLQYSSRRDLREQAFAAWTGRGGHQERDNRAIIAETLALRDEKARLLGFENFAAYKLDDAMAGTAQNVRGLLMDVFEPAKKAALDEQSRLQAWAQKSGDNIEIAGWDWRYYAQKLRVAEYELDESQIKPYFSLNAMIDAAFDTANRLFGLRFQELEGLQLYHADVRAFEVLDRDGQHQGLFLGDYFARPGKRSGAWMSGFRQQQKLKGDVRPIIVNVMNFAKGNPALLSFDDARTLFHEFGHALHGLMSDVTYPMIAGTAVSRDFVELPSQLFEHWLLSPKILKTHAKHWQTGEVIPDHLIERIIAAQNFNQGFAAVEFITSAMADIDLHTKPPSDAFDAGQAEQDLRARLDVPAAIGLRHRLPHFAHVFSGDGYASGYYSYLWSEVMDADAFAAFEETGDLFDPATAERLGRFVYSAGNKQDPRDAYQAFRGSMPSVEPLLKKRGFAAASPT